MGAAKDFHFGKRKIALTIRGRPDEFDFDGFSSDPASFPIFEGFDMASPSMKIFARNDLSGGVQNAHSKVLETPGAN